MEVCLVVAYDQNRVIGYKNKLAWELPADLAYVKNLTLDYPIIMGRKNFESIGRPLPRRRNIVLSRKPQQIENCEVFHNVEDVFHACQLESKIFIFGGAEIYNLFLPYVDTLYITYIHHEFVGDTVFPKLEKADWALNTQHSGIVNDENPYPHTYYKFTRIQGKQAIPV